MFSFRWHKGPFEESLNTREEYESLDEVIVMLRKSETLEHIDKIEAHAKFYAYDGRTKEDLYIVICEGFGVLGFLGAEPKKATDISIDVSFRM